MPAFELKNVSRSFVTPKDRSIFTALRDVNLDIASGKFICLVGPSGCGKSTALNMMAGLLSPTKGTVLYKGSQIRGPNSRVGYITQSDTLLPWTTIRKNVRLGLDIRKVGDRRTRESLVRAVLESVGLWDFRDHYPAQLSGGMRKRAILARSLVYEPETLLMDEPFGALDAQMRQRLQVQLINMWANAEVRRTVVFVTHDLEEALLLGDQVVVFGTDPGRIIHTEQVDYPHPRDLVHLRGEPHFVDQWRRLWDLIGDKPAPTQSGAT